MWHKMVSQNEEQKPEGFKFSEIVYKFLDNLQYDRSKRTLEWYQERLSLFVADFGPNPAAAIKPFEVLSSVNKHKNWSANTRRNSLRAIKRLYKWSHMNGLIDNNVMVNLEMPPQEARETIVTPEQMQELEQLLPEGTFKDLLRLAWDTGMRAEELFQIEAEWIKGDQIVIRPKSFKGK
jgi:integrase